MEECQETTTTLADALKLVRVKFDWQLQHCHFIKQYHLNTESYETLAQVLIVARFGEDVKSE